MTDSQVIERSRALDDLFFQSGQTMTEFVRDNAELLKEERARMKHWKLWSTTNPDAPAETHPGDTPPERVRALVWAYNEAWGGCTARLVEVTA
jgi:hypothetical protein